MKRRTVPEWGDVVLRAKEILSDDDFDKGTLASAIGIEIALMVLCINNTFTVKLGK